MKHTLVMLVLNALIYCAFGYLFMFVLGFSAPKVLLSCFVLSVLLAPITFMYLIYLYQMEISNERNNNN